MLLVKPEVFIIILLISSKRWLIGQSWLVEVMENNTSTELRLIERGSRLLGEKTVESPPPLSSSLLTFLEASDFIFSSPRLELSVFLPFFQLILFEV